jgi:hypothetical protein
MPLKKLGFKPGLINKQQHQEPKENGLMVILLGLDMDCQKKLVVGLN